jgi:hypothetical protein
MLMLRDQVGSLGHEVACRDVSAMGVGLRTTRMASLGTPCVVVFRSRTDQSAVAAAGVVSRCERVRDGLFDVGVRFDQVLDLNLVLSRDPFASHLHECVRPSQVLALLGELRIGVVAFDANDANMLRAVLGHERVLAPKKRAELIIEAMHLGAVLIEQDTPVGEIGEIAIDLYCNGFTGKIVLLAPSANEPARRMMEKLPIAAVALRPLTGEGLLNALADALGVQQGESQTASASPGTTRLGPKPATNPTGRRAAA